MIKITNEFLVAGTCNTVDSLRKDDVHPSQ